MAKINLQRIILHILKTGVEPFASPKYAHNFILQAVLKSIEDELEEKPARWYKYSANRSFKKLINEGKIKLDKRGLPQLTDRGNKQLAAYDFEEPAIRIPKTWDGKYRLISFDIDERKRRLRGKLRHQLVSLGFIRLHHSLWVFPYECEEVIALLKTYYGLPNDVLYITAESIENDNWLKKEFSL